MCRSTISPCWVCCFGKDHIPMVCIHMAKSSCHFRTAYIKNETSLVIHMPARSWNEKAPCTSSLWCFFLLARYSKDIRPQPSLPASTAQAVLMLEMISCFSSIPHLAQSERSLPSPSLLNEYSRKLLEEEEEARRAFAAQCLWMFLKTAPAITSCDKCNGGRKTLQVCFVFWGGLCCWALVGWFFNMLQCTKIEKTSRLLPVLL